jgi:hypothetical protein
MPKSGVPEIAIDPGSSARGAIAGSVVVGALVGAASTPAPTVDDDGITRSSGATWVQAIVATASDIARRTERN